MPVILECPFLSNGGALIDVKARKIAIRVYDEEMTYMAYKASFAPSHYEDLY